MAHEARIVVHAGMGKAGSSAIQDWLRRSPDVLSRSGYTLVVARPDNGPDLLTVAPYVSGPPTSGPVTAVLKEPALRTRAAERLSSELRRLADEHGHVVLTAEGLGGLLARRDAALLGVLSRLAGQHEVRVAYYVRPQHTALEASWRQWGFRSGNPPSVYLEQRSRGLHYLATLDGARAELPRAAFCMRPFRRDLLAEGDVVKDFARHVLGIGSHEVGGETSGNVGLSLTAVNVLATVPADRLWGARDDARRFTLLKEILAGTRVGEGAADARRLVAELEARDQGTDRGRAVLQRWAHARFEADNRVLLEQMGWAATEWVPEPQADDHGSDLALLDRFWAVPLPGSELEVLHRALERAVNGAAMRRRSRFLRR